MRYLTLWLQGGGTRELENMAIIPTPQKLEDIKDDKVVADYKHERSHLNNQE